MARQHDNLKKRGITGYDATRGFRVTHGSIGLPRIAGIMALVAIMLFLLVLGIVAKTK